MVVVHGTAVFLSRRRRESFWYQNGSARVLSFFEWSDGMPWGAEVLVALRSEHILEVALARALGLVGKGGGDVHLDGVLGLKLGYALLLLDVGYAPLLEVFYLR